MHDLSRVRDLNVRQMLDLLAVVDHGGVTAAAKIMNVSQPALTRSIRQLEESLGVALLERKGRGVAPTRFGLSMAQHARTIEAELRHATRDLTDLRKAEGGHLSIGGSPIGMATLIAPALAKLQGKWPGLTVDVRNDPFQAQLDALERGDVDILIGALAGADIQREHLVEEVLFQNHLSVVVGDGHPLTRRRGLSFADLTEEAWIIARGSASIGQLVANEFRFEGVDPPVFTVETDSILCVKGLLQSGNFICANPPELFASEIERGILKVLPIKWHSGARPVGFILREHGTVTPAMAALLDALREVGAARPR